MNAVFREYLLKGLFLGLWAYLALTRPDGPTFAQVCAWGGGGFALATLAGAAQQLLRGYRPLRNLPGFLLLVLLDSPYLIYLGLVGGFALGTVLVIPDAASPSAPGVADVPQEWLLYCCAAGAVLGVGFYQLRSVGAWQYRFGLGILLGAAFTYLAVYYATQEWSPLADEGAQKDFAKILLCGLPFFYLLTFCGEAEETEVEIGAICAALGVGLYFLRLKSELPNQFDKLIFLIPLGLYFVYATRWLPGLRVFKHNLRGYGYLSLGRSREALVSFARSLRLDRRNALAAEGVTRVLRKLDFATLDEATAKLLPLDFCLKTAERLLIGQVPSDAERVEAVRLVNLVARRDAALEPRADYLNAIADAHAHDYDQAAGWLAKLFDPETVYAGPQPNPAREAVLFDAWNLALRLHPRLVERLGQRELAKPGRRVEAIAAVERHLAKDPEEPTGVELKRELYAGLTEAEFLASAANGAPAGLNYDYLEQMGQSLLTSDDPAIVERGMAYLRMAARGQPGRGVALFLQLAERSEALGQREAALGYRGQIKRTGLAVGLAALPAAERAVYADSLKRLAAAAESAGDAAGAVENYRLYVEAGHEDADTLRTLAGLYEKDAGTPNAVLNALLITERGLLYAKADADLLARKDRYYFSVTPEALAEVRGKVKSWFDVAYCVRKARQVADQREADADTLDYGLHLIALARVIDPDSQSARFTEGRLKLRQGHRDAALELLENLRAQPRGSGDDEDAWFQATRLLGDLYLDELDRPDLAAQCFSDYRQYQKSGADTLYRLGEALEASGNAPGALKAYEAVTAYQGHPRHYDAGRAVERLKAGR